MDKLFTFSTIMLSLNKFITRIIHFLKKIKLNYFDVFILISITIVLGFFIISKITRKVEWVNVGVLVSNDSIWYRETTTDFWFTRELEIGKKSYNVLGEEVAEIVKKESYDSGGHSKTVFLDIKMKAQFDKNKNLYLFNYSPLQIGKPIEISFDNTNVQGMITYIGDIRYPSREIEVTVLKESEEDWLARSYKKGMKIEGSSGDVLAEIVDIELKPAKKFEFRDKDGRLFAFEGTDNSRKDVLIKLRMSVFKYEDRDLFYNGTAIKIGETLWLNFPGITLNDGVIVKYKEI